MFYIDPVRHPPQLGRSGRRYLVADPGIAAKPPVARRQEPTAGQQGRCQRQPAARAAGKSVRDEPRARAYSTCARDQNQPFACSARAPGICIGPVGSALLIPVRPIDDPFGGRWREKPGRKRRKPENRLPRQGRRGATLQRTSSSLAVGDASRRAVKQGQENEAELTNGKIRRFGTSRPSSPPQCVKSLTAQIFVADRANARGGGGWFTDHGPQTPSPTLQANGGEKQLVSLNSQQPRAAAERLTLNCRSIYQNEPIGRTRRRKPATSAYLLGAPRTACTRSRPKLSTVSICLCKYVRRWR